MRPFLLNESDCRFGLGKTYVIVKIYEEKIKEG